MWFLALSRHPNLVPPSQVAAEILSTLALVSISLNLILSTRARILERRARGLDRLFVTHRTVGLAVAVIVTTHFLIVPKSIGYVPQKPFGYATLGLLLVVIFVASAPRFPWRSLVTLRYENWKATHRFNGLFVVLIATHSLLAHTYVKQVPGLAAYVYGMASLGFAAWLYREFLFGRFGPLTLHHVERFEPLRGSVSEVTLSSPALHGRKPGQFAFLSLARGPSTEQHPFTISSRTDSPLRFSIKSSGDYTSRLAAGVPQGSKAVIEGPYGAFDFHRGGRFQLWIAGGIGITPFLSMAAALDDARDVLLVWSVKTREEAVYADELARDASARPGLRTVVHPTKELGHLDLSKLDLHAPIHDYSVFLCGPVQMRQAFERQLRGMGVPRSEIYYEEFRLR